MTHADWIRGMTDHQLACFISSLVNKSRQELISDFQRRGIIQEPVVNIDIPLMNTLSHLKWLRSKKNPEVDNG